MLRHQNNDDSVDDAQMVKIYQRELANLESWIQKQANFSKLDMSYNELVKDPASQVLRVADFLGGNLDQEAMTAVIDPNLYRNRL